MPLTWEVPAALALSWMLLAVMAMPVGQALASLLSGHGFAWPDHDLLGGTWLLLRGRPGEGLTHAEQLAMPGDAAVYSVIAVAELLVAGCAFFALRMWWRHGGPGTQWGLASRHDIEPVLGRRNLRRRRHLIRPDLYSTGRQA
jgi:type IV secretion system protein VirD4